MAFKNGEAEEENQQEVKQNQFKMKWKADINNLASRDVKEVMESLFQLVYWGEQDQTCTVALQIDLIQMCLLLLDCMLCPSVPTNSSELHKMHLNVSSSREPKCC